MWLDCMRPLDKKANRRELDGETGLTRARRSGQGEQRGGCQKSLELRQFPLAAEETRQWRCNVIASGWLGSLVGGLIWQARTERYASAPEAGAGGRLEA